MVSSADAGLIANFPHNIRLEGSFHKIVRFNSQLTTRISGASSHSHKGRGELDAFGLCSRKIDWRE